MEHLPQYLCESKISGPPSGVISRESFTILDLVAFTAMACGSEHFLAWV